MKKYTLKQKKKHFDLPLVERYLLEIVNVLNYELKKADIEQAVIEESKVKFPDCTISYSLDSDILIFHKHPKENDSSIISSVKAYFSPEGFYRFNNSEKVYNEISRDLLEDIIQYLLFLREK